jgi:hypothetical protein
MVPRGRAFARHYGPLLVLSLALPIAAAVYTGGPTPAEHFYTDDVPRLLAYAVPFLFPLGLAALATLSRRLEPSAPPEGTDLPRRAVPWVASPALGFFVAAGALLATVSAIALPFTLLDPYRRADLRGRTDGPFVLAFCRETLAFARRLAADKPVQYEPAGRRFKSGKSDPRHMERMRWFLREGWGDRPEYGMEEVVMRAVAASIVLPVFEPRELLLALELEAPRAVAMDLEVNGRPVGEVWAEPTPVRQRFTVPGAVLFRGDNRLTLRQREASALPVSLRVLNVRTDAPSGRGAADNHPVRTE